MIQAVPATKTPAVPTASRNAPSPSRFVLSLAPQPASGDDDGSSDGDDKATDPDGNARQDAAADGSTLPNGAAPVDPRLAWLALPVPVPPPAAPVPIATAASGALAAATGPGASAIDGPLPAPPPADPALAAMATLAGAAAPAPAAIDTPALPAAKATLAMDAPAILAKDAKTSAETALPIARPDPTQPATPTPALQAFAAAMRAGMKVDDGRTTRKDDIDALAPVGATPLSLETVRHAVAATGATQDQTLDTRRENWPSTMVDHIEALRDAADATSSRIRVVPDALGTIDLSVKRDGDTIHVHFDAAQSATRTLLMDAQPRLAEIAQSRGLRLGDTGVGGDASGAQQQRPPAQSVPTTPIPAMTRATDVASVADDTRIA